VTHTALVDVNSAFKKLGVASLEVETGNRNKTAPTKINTAKATASRRNGLSNGEYSRTRTKSLFMRVTVSHVRE